MVFKIEKKVLELAGGVYTGVVSAFGLDNTTPCEKISRLLQEEIAKASGEFGDKTVKESSSLDTYRQAMKAMGINPTKYPCSIESILTRISKTGQFPSLSPIVDLGNYISLKYRVPVGVHDLDTIDGALVVRLATEEDCEVPENSLDKDTLKVGEPVYAAGNSIRTRRWLWRQMPAGRVTEKASNFVFPIDGFIGNSEVVDKACEELSCLLKELYGATVETGVISQENSEFRFGPMTDEEREVENQIAIILKGVASHTSVDEIREKIRDAKKENRPLRVKLGLDPSAPDIHIGHSVVLRKIRQLQDLGHKAIIIIGDFTGMIGDPTGKSKTRKQLSREDVERNAQTYMEQIYKIIDRNRTELYYNSEWLSKMTFEDVIELSAKCTVARMLERDDFNNRYTNHLPLSVHEFFYPLMQAYDSVAIKADIELGGTDQTFNILMGRNIQRDYGQSPQLTLFMPLLEGIDGKEKMSKSLGNYIGISEEPAVIFEKVMQIPDDMIIKYYNLCTDIHPDEIARLMKALDDGANPKDVKIMLAREITTLYAGAQAAAEAENRFKSVYQQKRFPEDASVVKVKLEDGVDHFDSLATTLVQLGYFSSKSEIRRIFQQGGAVMGGVRISDLKLVNLADGKNCELQLGKKKFFKILPLS